VGLVRGERRGEIMFCLEGVLLFDGIGGYTDDGGPGLGEIGVEAGEILGLDGATGGVGLGIEEQDQFPAFEIGKRYRAAAVTGRRKSGAGAPSAGDWGICLPFVAFKRFGLGSMLLLGGQRWALAYFRHALTTGAIRFDG
jgi:hypothetical protein